jgi:hypothetical protein
MGSSLCFAVEYIYLVDLSSKIPSNDPLIHYNLVSWFSETATPSYNMQLIAISALLLSVAALVSASMIPENSPDGVYTFTFNSTGHEVLTYHGTVENLTSSEKPANISARDFLSKRRAAAAALSAGVDKRDYQTCSVYTGLDYDEAVLELAATCGVFGDSFRGTIAFQANGGEKAHYGR